LRRVGFEGERVSYALFKKLECIDVKWVDSSSIIRRFDGARMS
jgi:hypothetical protein